MADMQAPADRTPDLWEFPESFTDALAITSGLPVGEPMPIAPHYTVSEVSRWFFGKTPHWLRWLDREGHLVLDGEPIGHRESERDARSYNLAEIERIAYALHGSGHIARSRFILVLLLVQAQAMVYGMFSDPYEYQGKSYSLGVLDVADMANKSTTWVRERAEALGGIKRQWVEGKMQEAWRFPEDGLDEKIYKLTYNITTSESDT